MEKRKSRMINRIRNSRNDRNDRSRDGRSKNSRIRNAENLALERLDYIMESVEDPDFVEVIGRMGGDTITYRIYDDGSVYER